VPRRSLRAAPAGLVVVLATSGCGGNQNTLHAASSQQSSIVELFWVMFGASCVGFGVVVALLFVGWLRRERAGLTGRGGGDRAATRLVVILGVALPIVLLSLLFVWADIFVVRSTAAPAPGSTQLTVRVIAHQWWWEIRYPGTTVVTANELHIPIGTRVDVIGTSADVIHSLWVPELDRKVELIPGLTNRILLDATAPGTYRGQCSEFCGVQHAHMAIAVVAETPARFRAWLSSMERPALQPATAAQRAGRAVFLSEPCASCHTIRGTPAAGTVGPDLTHLAARATLAALTIPNTPSYLRGWLADPQAVKPGVLMPSVPLSQRQLDELTAYLSHLR
jgi:cytochrome c oxidase subunit 2